MNVTFGSAADGRTYPDHVGDGGSLCAPVVGPAGLLSLLERELGLTGPSDSEAVRVAAYAARLGKVTRLDPFWSASYGRDPWTTAELLLRWRDELVAAGWRGQAIGVRRIDDLAAAEAVSGPLPRGLADRLADVVQALHHTPECELDRLRLIEPRARIAPSWRRLIDAIEGSGVPVEEPPLAPAAAADTDLGRIQRYILGASAVPLQGDGSVVLLGADTALMASEAVAEWIDAGGETGLDGTVVFNPDRDSALLDQALSARGWPALGASAPSPWRGVLQVLPLAFATAWRPFNPQPLLDLLLLPRPPIGRYAAGRLARALTKEPGTGSAEWSQAWSDVEARLMKQHAALPAAAAARSVAQKLERWRAWTTGGLYDRAVGMTPAEARAIAARVGRWAIKADAGEGDPLLLQLAAAATAFSEAVDALDQPQLPALLIERVLRHVLADGAGNPDHVAEAGGLRLLVAAGALWGSAPRLVWWTFTGLGERAHPSPWDRAETAALAIAGVQLETAADAAARLSAAYGDIVLRTAETLLLVRPALSGSEESVSHPLAHQLDALLRPARALIEFRAESLLECDGCEVAGRTLRRRATLVADTPTPQARWTLPPRVAELIDDRVESATSLGRLVDCQLRWVLQDVLGLRGGRLDELPGPNQLFGNLAHAIAGEVLPPGPVAEPADVRRAAAAVFDDVLIRIAAPLLQPEHAGELAAARERVPDALGALARHLRSRGLHVVGTELDRSGVHDGALKLRGRLDLLVRSEAGELAVIDLKWSASAKKHRAYLTEGRALQLAVYGAIADDTGEGRAEGGFYLLSQRRMLAGRGSLLAEEAIEVTRTLPETLDGVGQTWRAWKQLAENGVGVAGGVVDAAVHAPPDLEFSPGDKPCRFCELGGLCRVHQVAL